MWCDITLCICCYMYVLWNAVPKRVFERNFTIRKPPIQTLTWVNSLYWPTEQQRVYPMYGLSFPYIVSLYCLSFCFCACCSSIQFQFSHNMPAARLHSPRFISEFHYIISFCYLFGTQFTICIRTAPNVKWTKRYRLNMKTVDGRNHIMIAVALTYGCWHIRCRSLATKTAHIFSSEYITMLTFIYSM